MTELIASHPGNNILQPFSLSPGSHIISSLSFLSLREGVINVLCRLEHATQRSLIFNNSSCHASLHSQEEASLATPSVALDYRCQHKQPGGSLNWFLFWTAVPKKMLPFPFKRWDCSMRRIMKQAFESNMGPWFLSCSLPALRSPHY